MPTAQTILDRKGGEVSTVKADESVLEAAHLMNKLRIGALVVREGQKIIGIFTERDILCRVVAESKSPSEVQVREVMTSPMAVCRRDTPLSECRMVMTQKRIRHLPVVEENTLHGMISSGDILASEMADHKSTIEYLHEYMHGYM